jgi:small subunit ribosomal protein S8
LVLKYTRREPAIHMIKRISKPGRRVYMKNDELPRVLSGLGISIVSTSNGLMTNKEARARKLGGEVLCEIA